MRPTCPNLLVHIFIVARSAEGPSDLGSRSAERPGATMHLPCLNVNTPRWRRAARPSRPDSLRGIHMCVIIFCCYPTTATILLKSMLNDLHPVFRKQLVLDSRNSRTTFWVIREEYFRNICIHVKSNFMKVVSIFGDHGGFLETSSNSLLKCIYTA